MKAVHLNQGGGRPLCGYRRWGSEEITSTKSPDDVTCKRCHRSPYWDAEVRGIERRQREAVPA